MCWSWQFVKFKFSSTGRNTSIQSEINPPPPPTPTASFWLSLPLSCFSYLFLFPFCNNYVSGSKCNYKGVGLVGSVGWWWWWWWWCVIALHAQQNATLKSYYQKREHFGRYTAEGSSRHMFVETGTTSQVVIINHHQERPVITLRRARSDWRCHGDKPTSRQACVYQDIKNTLPYFYLTLIISCQSFFWVSCWSVCVRVWERERISSQARLGREKIF